MIGKRKDSRASYSNVACTSSEGNYETEAPIEKHVWVLSVVGLLDVLSIALPMPQMLLTVVPYLPLHATLAEDRPKSWQSPEQVRLEGV